jgi:hypothetical protein
MKIKQGYKVRDIAGEKVVILQGKAGADMTRLVSLNSSAEWLYNQLCEVDSFEVADACNLLLTHYKIDSETATRDARAWAEKLLAVGIIENP